MSGLYYKTKQRIDEVLSKADKTQMMGPDLTQAFKLSELIKTTFTETRKRLKDVIIAITEDGKPAKNPECLMSEMLMLESNKYPDESLLSNILRTVGRIENGLSSELTNRDIRLDEEVRTTIINILKDKIPEIEAQRTKLSKLRFNLDIARSKLTKAKNTTQKNSKDQASQDKLDSLESEVEVALAAFDSQQDIFATEVLNFISNEKAYADIFISILEASRDYHKNCFELLEKSLTDIKLTSESTSRQPVFGLSLRQYKEIFENELSYVIEECCEYLNAKGLEAEGLFRISGSQYKVKKLVAEFNAGMTNFVADDPGVHNIATCLKYYLRELPEPILTYELEPEFEELSKLESVTRVNAVIDLIHRIPYENFVNLKCLIGLFRNVVAKTETNKMTASNIGIVVGPNLIWPRDHQNEISMSTIGSYVCEVLINEYHRVFETATPSNDKTTSQPQT